MRNHMCRVAVRGLGAFVAFLVISESANALDVSDTYRENRLAVVRDFTVGAGKLVPIPLSVGLSEDGSAASGVEIVARDPEGKALAIDQIEGGESRPAGAITDKTGMIVGLILYRETKEGSDQSSRAAIHLYFAASGGLLHRTVEFQCQKSSDEGRPFVLAENGLWDNDLQHLQLSLRAGCGVVRMYGGDDSQFLNLTGLDFSTALKDYPSSEYSVRIVVPFSRTGEVGRGKIDNQGLRSEEACLGDVLASKMPRVCGSDSSEFFATAWINDAGDVERGYECKQGKSVFENGTGYALLACNVDGVTDGDRPSAGFELRTSDGSKHVFTVNCDCQTLEVARLGGSLAERVISFNLITDAKDIDIDGFRLGVSAATASGATAAYSVEVPIYKVYFNEAWQVVRLSREVGAIQTNAEKSAPNSSEGEGENAGSAKSP